MTAPWKTISFWLYAALGTLPFLGLMALYNILVWIYPDIWLRVVTHVMKGTVIEQILLLTAGIPIGLITGLLMMRLARPAFRRLTSYDRWQRLRCTQCGYNVRAHVSGDRCPECGAIIAKCPSLTRPKSPSSALSRRSFLLVAVTSLSMASLGLLISGFPKDLFDVWFNVFLAVVPATLIWFMLHLRYQRWTTNKCLRCGHTLPSAGEFAEPRCLDCGAPVPAPPPLGNRVRPT